jgi:hypothetical protein
MKQRGCRRSGAITSRRWWNLHRLNNRTHRKDCWSVDGPVGSPAEWAIADKWNRPRPGPRSLARSRT